MKTKKIILAIALLIGGVLFTVDALDINNNGEETAAIDKDKISKIRAKLTWG